MINLELKPSDIRFTKETILPRFQNDRNHPGRLINDVIDDIIAGRDVTWQGFPPIAVVQMNGLYWSFNSRRLYMFRVLECEGVLDTIPVRLVQRELGRRRSNMRNGGIAVQLRNGAITRKHSAITLSNVALTRAADSNDEVSDSYGWIVRLFHFRRIGRSIYRVDVVDCYLVPTDRHRRSPQPIQHSRNDGLSEGENMFLFFVFSILMVLLYLLFPFLGNSENDQA